MKKTNTFNKFAACAIASAILLGQAAPAFAAETHFIQPAAVVTAFEEPTGLEDTYQIKFDTHGGTMSYHSVNTDETGNVTLPTEAPVKDGFNFIGCPQ